MKEDPLLIRQGASGVPQLVADLNLFAAQPVLILKSDDETVVNASCMTYTYTPTGADLTIKPLKDRYSDSPFDITITVSDGTNRVDRTV
ncbi:hypothetical protein LJC60_09415, partial [Ruminococcaceae bacterium OttesenSCG-928-D13]|nr:hypothetical protein [Ruminococcaceae bacterium OttesenSCG-928-D13]